MSINKISNITGRKPISCDCLKCQKQCTMAPCLGTPEDIEKIIDAGYKENIMLSEWAAGIMMGVMDTTIMMYQAIYDDSKKACIFFENGKCMLHDKGLKPTEGKLSHHSVSKDNFVPKKSLSYNVAKEWVDPKNAQTISRITLKIYGVMPLGSK